MHLHVFKVVTWLATLAWTRHCEGKLTNSCLTFISILTTYVNNRINSEVNKQSYKL